MIYIVDKKKNVLLAFTNTMIDFSYEYHENKTWLSIEFVTPDNSERSYQFAIFPFGLDIERGVDVIVNAFFKQSTMGNPSPVWFDLDNLRRALKEYFSNKDITDYEV